jgi:hypothetical protein
MKHITIFFLLFSSLLTADCEERAYDLGVGESKSSLESKRSNDKQYNSMICPCASQINSDVKDATLKITEKRVNPATDILIKSLENQLIASDTKIRELVNLKYLNNIYSFYGKNDTSGATLSSTVDGCGVAFNFPAVSNVKAFYREGILEEILSILHSWKSSAESQEQINKLNMYIKE